MFKGNKPNNRSLCEDMDKDCDFVPDTVVIEILLEAMSTYPQE